ncbi:hypothetical protein MA16_Dca009936 [Dendrobium catenatum]|uniref:Uncharacterized protein n=1 Tax=Dendrobium catenatum TaxID=906689 RepID=A0A2I0WD90_9ASPA|nr:hypothetical protein MA16_Dca009936 [Dendrobium catenatum]
MNDLRLSTVNGEYKAALKATDNIEPPSVGFVNPSEARQHSASAFGAMIKQNNTVIQLLLTITERVKDLEGPSRSKSYNRSHQYLLKLLNLLFLPFKISSKTYPLVNL